MKITAPCVVTLTWHVQDSMQQDISQEEEPIEYFYGGGDLLPKIEEALLDHEKSEQLDLYLEPEHTFGEYDSNLVFFEERHIFPEDVSEGMQFEGLPDGAKNTASSDTIFNVTEVYDEYIVIDGNHPLAGISLRLHINIVDVRPATDEEIHAGSTSSNMFSLSPPVMQHTVH